MEKFYVIRTELRLDGEELEVTTKFTHTQEKAEEVAELEVGDFEHIHSNIKDNDIWGADEDTDTTMYREDCYGNSIFVEIKEITDEDFEK